MINGMDYSTGDTSYSRVKEYVESCGIKDQKVQCQNAADDGWLFYTVILYSDGTFRIASGNASDDSAAYTKTSGIETPTNYWYTAAASNMEKAMNIR